MTQKKTISGPMTITLQPDEVICRAGDHESDLYIVHSGRLLVFVVNGTKITPLAYLTDGEYLGELSYFDHQPRSAYVVAVEETTLIQIPTAELDRQFPPWLILMARHVTRKLRETDELIRQKGLRKQNVEGIKPLSIDEQRHYMSLIGQD